MYRKRDRRFGPTLSRSDKWSNNNPGDCIGEDEVGDDRVLFHPKRRPPTHDRGLPFPAFYEPRKYTGKRADLLECKTRGRDSATLSLPESTFLGYPGLVGEKAMQR